MSATRPSSIGECVVCGATVLGETAQQRHADWHNAINATLTQALETACEAKADLWQQMGGWPANQYSKASVVGLPLRRSEIVGLALPEIDR